MTPKFCPECGTKAPSIAAKFCSSCGNSLDIFAAQKSSPVKRAVARSSDIDEDDEDGSDVFTIPSLSALKNSKGARIEREDDLGFSSFTFGENGFTPTSFIKPRR